MEIPNDKPLVSIVIPTYNRASTVCNAVESALAQSYPFCQVIVVDDGSEDNTVSLLAQYAGRITLIRQKNRGRSAARNTGLTQVKGEYVVFLDSDDTLMPNMVEGHLAAMICSPSAALITGLAWMTDLYGQLVVPKVLMGAPLEKPTFLSLILGNVPLIHTILVRRDAVVAVGGFDETLAVSEDWDLWLRIVSCFPDVGFVSEPCAYCAAEPALGTTRLGKYQVQVNTIRMIENAFELLPVLSPLQAYKPMVFARANVQWGACVELALGRHQSATSYIEVAKRWVPQLEKEMDIVPRGVSQFATWYEANGVKFIKSFFEAFPEFRIAQGRTLALYFSKQAHLALQTKNYIAALALGVRAIDADPLAALWAGKRFINRVLIQS